MTKDETVEGGAIKSDRELKISSSDLGELTVMIENLVQRVGKLESAGPEKATTSASDENLEGEQKQPEIDSSGSEDNSRLQIIKPSGSSKVTVTWTDPKFAQQGTTVTLKRGTTVIPSFDTQFRGGEIKAKFNLHGLKPESWPGKWHLIIANTDGEGQEKVVDLQEKS
jgi:hypothetical protein